MTRRAAAGSGLAAVALLALAAWGAVAWSRQRAWDRDLHRARTDVALRR